MEPGQRMSRISGARRRPQRSYVVWAAAAFVGAVVLVLVLTGGEPKGRLEPTPVPPAPTSGIRVVATPAPSPRPPMPSPSPTPPTVSGSVKVDLTPTASGRSVRERTPEPTATPAPENCVRVRSAWARSGPDAAHIVVEVEIENDCGHDLGPLEAWVWVGGFRDGHLVQSARGHPFERVRAGREARITIGLPGSATWYDRIEARALPVASHPR